VAGIINLSQVKYCDAREFGRRNHPCPSVLLTDRENGKYPDYKLVTSLRHLSRIGVSQLAEEDPHCG